MERRKHRGSNLDELAKVKAAAWAWYQNGSGAEGRPMREYDLARTQRTSKPSRYKLEAMKVHQEQEDLILKQMPSSSSSPLIRPSSSSGRSSTTVVGEKSLFDTYEIERISRELHSYIHSSRIENLKSIFGGGGGGNNCNSDTGYRKVASLLSEESGRIVHKNSSCSINSSKPKHNKTLKGFWPVICGSGHDDVVVEATEGGRRIRFGRSSSRRGQ